MELFYEFKILISIITKLDKRLAVICIPTTTILDQNESSNINNTNEINMENLSFFSQLKQLTLEPNEKSLLDYKMKKLDTPIIQVAKY